MRRCPPRTRPYRIKPGDTLYRLAMRFGTTVPAIISANPMVDPMFLQIGQVICIPMQAIYPSCPEGNYYRIRPGDTLYNIAQFYNISLEDLLEANPGINPNMLMIGQVICIPLATPPVTCREGYQEYEIKAGDTFYGIAKRFDLSTERLIEANPNVNPRSLLVGQKICVPSTRTIDIRLYYGNQDNSELVYSTKEISYETNKEKYRKTLEALIEGPYEENMRRNINEETKVLSIDRPDGDLTVNLSEEFLSFPGTLAYTVSVRSIVETLTQFDEVDRVRITVEGEPLTLPSGRPMDFQD